jgi:hypothetical protein
VPNDTVIDDITLDHLFVDIVELKADELMTQMTPTTAKTNIMDICILRPFVLHRGPPNPVVEGEEHSRRLVLFFAVEKKDTLHPIDSDQQNTIVDIALRVLRPTKFAFLECYRQYKKVKGFDIDFGAEVNKSLENAVSLLDNKELHIERIKKTKEAQRKSEKDPEEMVVKEAYTKDGLIAILKLIQ